MVDDRSRQTVENIVVVFMQMFSERIKQLYRMALYSTHAVQQKTLNKTKHGKRLASYTALQTKEKINQQEKLLNTTQ